MVKQEEGDAEGLRALKRDSRAESEAEHEGQRPTDGLAPTPASATCSLSFLICEVGGIACGGLGPAGSGKHACDPYQLDQGSSLPVAAVANGHTPGG